MRYILATLGSLLAVGANATLYDLKTDWSDSVNPNGVWAYREGVNALPHVASWQSTLGGWATAQQGWAKSENGNDRLPFIFKSNGSETFAHDFLAGDIVMHSTDGTNGVGSGPGNIAWTASGSGIASITGSVWLGRDIGRAVDWKVFKNGTQLSTGSLFSGDSFSRANPFNLAAGSGGASVLNNISVVAGDKLILEMDTVGGSGDFVGMNYSVNYSPVPEPVSIVTLGGAVLLSLRRKRRYPRRA